MILSRDFHYSVLVTVIEVIKKSADFLAKKGIESPRLDSELIISHALGIPRLHLYLNFNKTIPQDKTEIIKEMVIQRGKRIPLQHILGSAVFCGVNLKIDRRALVPRPETEILVETAIELAKTKNLVNPAVLDFGTGSGCIAIAVALKIPDAKVVGIDLSQDAIDLAKENAELNKVGTKIEFYKSSGYDIFKNETVIHPHNNSIGDSDIYEQKKSFVFDLILSNPPYIPTDEINNLQPEVKEHDPLTALDGGKDGLDVIRYLARESAIYLKPQGVMIIEIGAGQSAAVSDIMRENGWIIHSVIKDYNKIDRVMVLGKQ
ncbi:MAG: peptide chain release factor N(5)-glutamine methyltransferase [Verrucomicrobiia bacterium]